MSRQPGTQGSSGGRRNLPIRTSGSGSGGGGGGPGGSGGQRCHQCGNLGHTRKQCPHLGGPGQGAYRPPNRVPPPSAPLQPISMSLAHETSKEDKLVKVFENVNRTAEGKPCRPSYGFKGDTVEFRTNYFPVKLPDELVLHRYSIKVDVEYDEGKQLPEPRNKKLKRIIQLMLERLRNLKFQMPIATDFKSNLVCGAMIPQNLWATKIQYFHENDLGPSNDSRTYTVRIAETPPVLKISELRNFLAPTTEIAPLSDRESMLQALNMILGQYAKSSREISMVGGNKGFSNVKDEYTEQRDLEAGLEAIRGYFLSVRLATFRAMVNVNVCHGAFYEAISLQVLINNWTAFPGNHDNNGESKWGELETFLKGLKVRTDYLRDANDRRVTQVRSIKSFASTKDGEGTKHPPRVDYFAAPPNSVSFYLDDGKEVQDVAKQSLKTKDNKNRAKDKYIRVGDFFNRKYSIPPNPRELYPVLNFASRKDPVYVPAEACTVEPGQLAKLTPSQTDTMIKFAARSPPKNEHSIKNKGLRILGLWPTAVKLGQFGLEIDDRMVAVQGRMLTKPRAMYKGESPANEATGGWNLSGSQFKTPVPKTNGELNSWGCLIIRSFGDNRRYDPTITEFRESLKACGIKTGNPLMGEIVYDNRNEVFVPVKRGLDLHSIIQQRYQPHKPAILLVILPRKIPVLYNRIKKLFDQTEGIHTVCVVEAGFRTKGPNYFANVALKFNLKLGGTNHTLEKLDLGIVAQKKTMVVGIDVVHPSPGSGKASVASMVASIDEILAQWPVDLQVQVREGQEMLDKIDTMLTSRLALWRKKHNVYPENILIYRDGVSESQYQQVLDEELAPMRECCRTLYDHVGEPRPRFTLIIVGKRHHTRFFPPEKHPFRDRNGNPKRGLVVDRGITEARNWDFFLQSHDAIQGTARPAHYYVLWDEIFTDPSLQSVHDAIESGVLPADRVERLSHSLCYMFSRAAKAVSIPAPVYYADIACTRAKCYLAESSTGAQSVTGDKTELTAAERERLSAEYQAEIRVHDDLKDSMFYV